MRGNMPMPVSMSLCTALLAFLLARAAAGLPAGDADMAITHTGTEASMTADERAAEPVLVAERLYNGVGRTVMIRITPPAEHVDAARQGLLRLAVMNHDGEMLMGPLAVRPGRMDLAERFTELWQLERSAWLQCLIIDPADAPAAGAAEETEIMQPLGTPLVLQPMRTRMVPVTESDRRPAGQTYTRITGWRSALEPTSADQQNQQDQDQNQQQQRRESGSNASGNAANTTATAQQQSSVDARPRRISTGLRIYRDQDVVLDTTLGEIRFAMRPDAAPNTAWNFLQLSEGGFYRDVIFHRIVPLDRQGLPFVIQAGDPSGDGQGGPGYWLPLEPSTLPHDFGVISMARADAPDSAGSQFFVCLSREGTARLDGQYCAFGIAVDGHDVIRAIADVELADIARGRPADPPMIRAATLINAQPRVPNIGRPDLYEAPQQQQPAPRQGDDASPGRVDR